MPDGFIPGLNWTTGSAAAPLTTPSFNLYKTARNCCSKNKAILNTCKLHYSNRTPVVGVIKIVFNNYLDKGVMD